MFPAAGGMTGIFLRALPSLSPCLPACPHLSLSVCPVQLCLNNRAGDSSPDMSCFKISTQRPCNNPPLTHTHTHTHPHPTLSLSCGHNPPTPQRTHTQTPCPTPQPPHPGAVPLTFLLIHPPRHYQTEKIERRRRRRARERGKKRSSQNRSAIHSLDIVLHHWP